MAYLLRRHCMLIRPKILSLCEMNRLNNIFNEIRTGVGKNEKFFSPARQYRNFSTDNNEAKKKEIPKYESVEQVYYGPLTKQVRSVKVFTILSSIAGLLAQPMLYAKIQELGVSAPVIAMGTFYGFFVLVSPLLVHMVTKRYVTHVEYNKKSNSYIASTYTFFIRRKKIEFTPEDVKVPEIGGIFTTIIVKGKPLFLDPKMFQDRNHYIKIMGYDKPIDFSIDTEDSENQKK